jgi:hypothetical protein
MVQTVTSPTPSTGGRRRRSIARATGNAAGVSTNEKREARPPAGAVSTGTRRQKEKGPRAVLPSSRRARPVGVVRGEA